VSWRLALVARFAGLASVWAVLAAVVGLLLMMAAPKLVGGQGYAVLSNSMKGAVDTGDQVVVLPQAAREIRVGEIVAFDDPDGSGKLFQHRVQHLERIGSELEVTTKGDANTGDERWRVPVDGEVGRVVAVVPGAGYVLGRLGTPIGRGLLIALAALAALAVALTTIWQRPAEPTQEAHHA